MTALHSEDSVSVSLMRYSSHLERFHEKKGGLRVTDLILITLLFVFDFYFQQELSKIAMPVVFNEPLSFLQRISEYMEHTYLIHKACSLSDPIERMQVAIIVDNNASSLNISIMEIYIYIYI